MSKRLFIPAMILSLLTSTSMAMAFESQPVDNNKTNTLQTTQEQPECCCKHHFREHGREEFRQKLEKAGITKEQFEAAHQKGPEAVNALLKAHGIKAPDHFGGPNREEFMQKLQKAGITKKQFETARKQGPEAVHTLLKAHGIKAPDHFGGPNREEFMQKLQKAGITKEQFKAARKQGPEAVHALLQAHGIQPAKDFHREEKGTNFPSE